MTFLPLRPFRHTKSSPPDLHPRGLPMRNASGFLLLFAENCSENQAHKRAAIKHLVADCHREIHRPCLHPCCKRLCILKQNGRDQAHQRAHDAADADRNGIGDELRSIRRPHDRKRQPPCNFPDGKNSSTKAMGTIMGSSWSASRKLSAVSPPVASATL